MEVFAGTGVKCIIKKPVIETHMTSDNLMYFIRGGSYKYCYLFNCEFQIVYHQQFHMLQIVLQVIPSPC